MSTIIEKDDPLSLSQQKHRQLNKRLKNTVIYKPIVVGTISSAQGKKGQKEQLFSYFSF